MSGIRIIKEYNDNYKGYKRAQILITYLEYLVLILDNTDEKNRVDWALEETCLIFDVHG